MRIAHNLSALGAWRVNQSNHSSTQNSLEKLSSGLRINKAGDDAAGLAISEKMRGQIRGTAQSLRNIHDGISLVQTAEGGMQEIHSLLQRGRELSVQAANGTNTVADRQSIQAEIGQIVKEVDRIAQTTQFNSKNLLNVQSASPEQTAIINGLKTSWIGRGLERINLEYGLQVPANTTLPIKIVQGSSGGTTAYVSTFVNGLPGTGTLDSLTIELADFNAANSTIGGLQADRTVTHELVHAVMSQLMNWSQTVTGAEATGIATWFKEGTAEFIHGADERVNGDLFGLGGNKQALVDLNGLAGDPWVSDSAHYSAAYVAVKYMDDRIRTSGGAGIKDIMAQLSSSTSMSLDQAIKNVGTARGITTWSTTGVSAFKSEFRTDGANFINTKMNLADTDTGAIDGLDYHAGNATFTLTDTSVISETATSATYNFNIQWPAVPDSEPLQIQVGANANNQLSIALSNVDSSALGIKTVNVTTDAGDGINRFDNAIQSVSAERSRLGALQNRLEHAASVTDISNLNLTDSESRIRDVDMAKEMMAFTKNNLLSQASLSMLTLANQQPQGVLQLLH